MLRVDKIIKPWKESAALNDHINLYGFWNERTFLTKSGDVGMVLSISGVDYESLDRAEQEYAVKRLEAALKAFGLGVHVYQYLFKSNCPDIPFATYDDPVVDAAIDQRRKFFEAKREHLYQVEIFYCVLVEGARSKSGVTAALARLFRDPAGAVSELRTQFTNDSMKTLLRAHVEHDVRRLDQQVQAFARQLADFMQIEVLNQQGQFTFFLRLLNYDDWRVAGRPQSTQFLDYQVVNSDIEAERDHLRVGDHIVRVLTMKEAIIETRPLVLDALLKIPANFYVVTEWTPLPADRARKEVNKRRRHFNMSKTGFVSQMGNDPTKTNPRDVLVDESKQADIENLGDCLRALGDGQSLGDFSLTIVLYGRSRAELDPLVAEFTGVFTNADGNLFAETYNQLNAYFATVPGNYALNLRQLYLLNSNYADMSFLFTILPGEKTNAHLGTEYLAALETDNNTPYFLNLHNGEVAHTLILGMTGSGKSYFCNFLLQNAQKYAPLTFIFDIGGSFQSLTTIFGGSYLNVGQEARDFTINPFSLSQTKENLQFLFSFFRVLIEGTEQRYRIDFKEERRLWDAIERMYVLEPNQRTVSNFGNIIGELKERLHRWTHGGQYGFLFDNAEDTLSFSRFQTFNFHGWNDAPEVLEPLLFYVLHRASNEIANPTRLATFKMFLLDEAWLFIKNETIRNYVVQAQKTWRKHNAAMILATQSIKELEESGMLAIVAESCPTKIFLANPEMNREVYREAFHLNDTELDLISGLVPPGQMLVRKAQTSLESGRSEVLTQYLGAMARFHTYSFGNVMLIARQKPDASNVAGIRTWNSLGRFVKRGEKGILILAPMVGKKRTTSEGTEQTVDAKGTESILFGFRAVYVFDINQTEGKELPTLTEVQGDVSGCRERLVQFVAAQGIELNYSERIGPAKGLSHGGKITLLLGMQPAEEFSTLVHEIGHEMLHRGDRRTLTTKQVRETEAEAVAFVVCQSVGLQTGTASADYIQLWHGDANLLRESLEAVQQTAAVILGGIAPEPAVATAAA